MLTNQNKVLTHNDKWLEPETNAYYYNPLNLPPYTIRVVYKNGTKPVLTGQYGYWAGNHHRVNPNLVSMKQISSVPNVWDITYSTDQWIYLFYEEVNLLKVLGANTTGVTNMNGLFQNCHNLNEVALFDTSSVIDMGGMFGNTIVFSSGYYDGHSSLETIPLFDTHNVTNMSGMFDSAPGLKYVPNLNTSKVTNMGRMFAFCFGLEETPLLDTKSATYIDEMFYKCTGLKKINEFAFTSVNSCNYIFSNCYNVESGMLEMYDALRNAYTGRETRVGYDHNQAFKNCGFTHKYVDGVWTKVYASEDSQYAQAHIPDTWGGEMVKVHVYTTGTNGTVSAVPNYDYPETTVTLSNTPNEGYEFDSYSVTGATIYDGNKLDIGYSDVNVHGNFNGIVRTITCSGEHGTVTATPNTGIIGDTITLSNTPASGYDFVSYSITGATLKNSNQFDIGTSDVNVVGNFLGQVQHITCTGDYGTVTASQYYARPGTTITLSNTPNTGYELNSYSVSGATLYDGNKFDVGFSNVKVKGNFKHLEEITIGNQTWMGVNLAVNDGGSGILVKRNVIADGYNIGDQYYYTQAAAIRVANSIPGWHLPTKDEWLQLEAYLEANVSYQDGKVLKSTYSWTDDGNGTDVLGFTAFAAGRYYTVYEHMGTNAYFWSSTNDGTGPNYNAHWCQLINYGNFLSLVSSSDTRIYNSVRLIKDS